MDEFIDPYLHASTWSNICASPMRSSWMTNVLTQTSTLLGGSVGENVADEKSSNVCLFPTSDVVDNVASSGSDFHSHDGSSSQFVDRNLKYGVVKGMFSAEHQLPHQEVLVNNSAAPLFCTKLDSQCSSALPLSVLTDSGSIKCVSSELSAFPQSFGDSNSVSSVSTVWPPHYSGAFSLNMDQGKLQSFSAQNVDAVADVINKDQGLLCTQLHSFTAGQHLNLPRHDGSQIYNHQLIQALEVNNVQNYPAPSSCALSDSTQITGAVKPRVRARRGQATDPHSIAERLRREKIADRMKNLQELVPNSNKPDKASVLDEIIDYVKFLQLQVKVLSMSRLGAAGAVVPLITDANSEICGGGGALSVGRAGTDFSDTQDGLALEQEVVKMMECNVTGAMQYLQNKGLCLMPVALASAISSQKGCLPGAVIPGARNTS